MIPSRRSAIHTRGAAINSHRTTINSHGTAINSHRPAERWLRSAEPRDSSAALSARHQGFMPKWLFLPSRTAAHAPELEGNAGSTPLNRSIPNQPTSLRPSRSLLLSMPAKPREGEALLHGPQFRQTCPRAVTDRYRPFSQLPKNQSLRAFPDVQTMVVKIG